MLKLHRDAHTRNNLAVALWAAGSALAGSLAYAAVPATVTPVAAAVSLPPIPIAEPAPPQRVQLPPQAAQQRTPARIAPLQVAPLALRIADASAPAYATPVLAAAPQAGDLDRGLASSRVTFRFRDSELLSFVKVVGDMTGVRFSDTEQMRGVRFGIERRNVLVNQAVRTVLACAGFSLARTEAGYAVTKLADTPPREEIDACIKAELPEGPEPPAPTPAALAAAAAMEAKRYAVDMDVFQDGVLVKTSHATARAREAFAAQVSDDLTLECAPYVIAAKLYVGCKALGANVPPPKAGVLVEGGHMQKVELGKATTVEFSKVPGTSMRMTFTEVAS